ncbi:hypothetical protein XA68_10811 [Ophiocordyceps unilateralis]|uniref:Uncharacterized protein n=1 Tax=Ophiocordyceps unilateralis TaxID=268505 RepID=A0A2A9PHN2_OPHUN|nr:hypothetical protein XA68_10811 [Ophiocordyceps unilateralis]
MNPLAIEFTPSISPVKAASRHPPRAPRGLAREIRHADLSAACLPVRSDVCVASAGPWVHPDLTQSRSLAVPDDEDGRFHAVAPRRVQAHTSSAAHYEPQPPRLYHPITGAPASRPSNIEHFETESLRDDTNLFQAGFLLHSVPWANDYAAKDAAHRRQAVLQPTTASPQHHFDTRQPEWFPPGSHLQDTNSRLQAAIPTNRRVFATPNRIFSRPANREALVASGAQQPTRPQPWTQPLVSQCDENDVGFQYTYPQYPYEPDLVLPRYRPPIAGDESLWTEQGAREQSSRQALLLGRVGGLESRRVVEPQTVSFPCDFHNETSPGIQFESSSSRYYSPAAAPIHPQQPSTSPETSVPSLVLPRQILRTSENQLSAILGGASAVRHLRPGTRGYETNLSPVPESTSQRRVFLREPFAPDFSGRRQSPETSGDYGPRVQQSRVRVADAPACQYHTAPPVKLPKSPISTSPTSECGSSQVADTVTSIESMPSREAPMAQGPPGGEATDSASWTRSRRWMSNEMKERVGFLKTMTNLRHIKAEKSPFVPQSLTELAAFKAEVAEANRRRLERAVGRRQAELQLKQGQGGAKSTEVRVGKLFRGKQFHDGKSAVFASDNCFNELTGPSETHNDWPSLTELKGEGNRRGESHHRRLPRPRQSLQLQSPDDMGHWQDKPLSSNSSNPAFIMAVSPPDVLPQPLAEYGPCHDRWAAEPELSFHDLPGHLQATICHVFGALYHVDNA